MKSSLKLTAGEINLISDYESSFVNRSSSVENNLSFFRGYESFSETKRTDEGDVNRF